MNQVSNPGTKLLVSVRNSEELEAAVEGGADWIDLKEPLAGPLAGVDVQVAQEAVQVLAGRRALSAALGELRDWHSSESVRLLELPGISVVKLGLSRCVGWHDWQQHWRIASAAAAEFNKQMVAVVYADWQRAEAPTPQEILSLAKTSGANYLLIDTFDKTFGNVFDHLSMESLRQILISAQQSSITTVVAGSISAEQVSLLPHELVGMVAVRGAVCRCDRTSSVESSLVRNFRQVLDQYSHEKS